MVLPVPEPVAIGQSMGLVWYYAESNPTMSRWGRRTLDRLVGAGA